MRYTNTMSMASGFSQSAMGAQDDHPTRAEFATSLVSALELDARLIRAVAVFEARNPGFVGRVLEDAAALAATSDRDVHALSAFSLADAAMADALRNSGVRLALDTLRDPVAERLVDALSELIVSQARFHSVAGDLERRGLTRSRSSGVGTAPR